MNIERGEIDIPEEYLRQVETVRNQLIEKLADFNDEIAELFLDDQEVPIELLKTAAREATLKLLITPVFLRCSL